MGKGQRVQFYPTMSELYISEKKRKEKVQEEEETRIYALFWGMREEYVMFSVHDDVLMLSFPSL